MYGNYKGKHVLTVLHIYTVPQRQEKGKTMKRGGKQWEKGQPMTHSGGNPREGDFDMDVHVHINS